MIFVLALLAASSLEGAAPQFEKSEVCASCHLRIAPPKASTLAGSGSIAPVALWSGSMKAFSARDPYWLAKVRSEVAITPAAKAVIEDKCLRCHAPTQQYGYRGASKLMPLADLNATGREGVTCTVCHQITPKGLGSRASFTGGFEINGKNEIYGPHADPFQMPMEHHTNYTPTESRHVLESAFCATCHTVITPTLNAKGEAIGEFVEQAPYLEWLASSFPKAGKTCQSCHMPLLKDSAGTAVPSYIAHSPGGMAFPPTRPRTPFGLHFFAGGNFQMPRIMADLYPDEGDLLRQTESRATSSLRESLSLQVSTRREGEALLVTVKTVNRTGHKLPTAYPSRRLWLHVEVRDSAGNKAFESGAWNAALGEIEGGGAQPHHRRVVSPNQVVIYEAEYRDPDGKPTTSLLRAAGYRKDNRILPLGFDGTVPLPKGVPEGGINSVGVEGDRDFIAGSDTVEYEMRPKGAGPYTVRVEALFQNLKPAHLEGLEASFLKLAQKHSQPLVMAASCPPVPSAKADAHPCP